ncbi:BnaCnng42770D [Brassica napus]|uniref:BnaCnng42770D protein n=1 Tax=Brassica napus TaxID=3708 RepID=A0A078JFL8_BRANA|nr:BnaCnng42770D [Brassica napus]
MAQSQMPSGFDLHSLWYDSSLRSVSQSAQLLYTYANAIHGFSTRLTPEEADSLMTLPGVISVLPEHRYELHTTRTPLFLGLDVHNADLFPETGSSSDVVVRVLDTGVWPESKSFSDVGLGPVASTWRGGCEAGTNFTASLWKNYSGVSLFKGDALPDKTLPFVYAGNATNAANGNLSMKPGTLIPEKVKAKIVMCDRGLVADAHLLPATAV